MNARHETVIVPSRVYFTGEDAVNARENGFRKGGSLQAFSLGFAAAVLTLLESPTTMRGSLAKSTSKSRRLRCASRLYRFVASMITVGRSKGSFNIVSWPLSTLVRS